MTWFQSPGAEIGRQACLRGMCSLGRAGSSPAPGTYQYLSFLMKFLPFYLVLFLVTRPEVNIWSQDFTSTLIGDNADVSVPTSPCLVLAGGGPDNDEAMRWMLQHAQGGDIVVLRASGGEGYNQYFYSELGVPVNSVETLLFLNRNASFDLEVLEKIRTAEIVFIAGGDQSRYYDFWHNTPVASLLSEGYKQKTKIIGGTSAGMMILGSVIYTPSGVSVISGEALADPYHPHMDSLAYNALFDAPVFKDVLFETHFDERGRSGRLIAFLARIAKDKNIRARAIALNESTALGIDSNNMAKAFGAYPDYEDFAYFVEVNCETNWQPQIVEPGIPLHWLSEFDNAVTVQKVSATNRTEYSFDLTLWEALNNVKYEHWQVNHGVLMKTEANSKQCRQVLTNTINVEKSRPVVFPNPAEEVVQFDLATRACLKSADGKMLNYCSSCDFLPTGTLPGGIYLLSLQYGDESFCAKVIVL